MLAPDNRLEPIWSHLTTAQPDLDHQGMGPSLVRFLVFRDLIAGSRASRETKVLPKTRSCSFSNTRNKIESQSSQTRVVFVYT